MANNCETLQPLAIENRVRRHIKKCKIFKKFQEIYTPLAFYKEPKNLNILREFIGKPITTKSDKLQDALKQLEDCQKKNLELVQKIEKLEIDLISSNVLCDIWKTEHSKLEQKTNINSFCTCTFA